MVTGGPPARPGERPVSPPARAPQRAAPSGDGDRWADNWRANEIRWLRTQVADLERRLRRRTIALAVALAFGGFVTGAAAGAAVVLLNDEEPGWIGRIAGDGPASDPADTATGPTAPAAAAARPDVVVRALEAANEELEAVIGGAAREGREP